MWTEFFCFPIKPLFVLNTRNLFSKSWPGGTIHLLRYTMFPKCSDLCWRCGEETGSLLHIFWVCDYCFPFGSHNPKFYWLWPTKGPSTLPSASPLFLRQGLQVFYLATSDYHSKELHPALLETGTCTAYYHPVEKSCWNQRIGEPVASERGIPNKFHKQWFYWH